VAIRCPSTRPHWPVPPYLHTNTRAARLRSRRHPLHDDERRSCCCTPPPPTNPHLGHAQPRGHAAYAPPFPSPAVDDGLGASTLLLFRFMLASACHVQGLRSKLCKLTEAGPASGPTLCLPHSSHGWPLDIILTEMAVLTARLLREALRGGSRRQPTAKGLKPAQVLAELGAPAPPA